MSKLILIFMLFAIFFQNINSINENILTTTLRPFIIYAETNSTNHQNITKRQDFIENINHNLFKCGGVFKNHQTLIYSSNYPRNYPSNLDCEYVLKSKFQCKNEYHLQFLDFKLETSKDCENDYLEISYNQMNERICGQVIGIKIYKTHNGILRIKFHTNNIYENKGFKLLVTRLPCTNELESSESKSLENDLNSIESESSNIERPSNVILPPLENSDESKLQNNIELKSNQYLPSIGNLPPNYSENSFWNTNQGPFLCYPIPNNIPTNFNPVLGQSPNIPHNPNHFANNNYPNENFPGNYIPNDPNNIHPSGYFPNNPNNINPAGYFPNNPNNINPSGYFPTNYYPNNNIPTSNSPHDINTNNNFPNPSYPHDIPNNFPNVNIDPFESTTDKLPYNSTTLNIPKVEAQVLPWIPQSIPSCCANIFRQKRFYLSSVGFPRSPPYPLDCLYYIERYSPNVCRLRINFKFFNMGIPTPLPNNFNYLGTPIPPVACLEDFIEIDGQKLCGCRTDLAYISQWGLGAKVIRFKVTGRQLPINSGFILDIIQEDCPYRYLRNVNDRIKRRSDKRAMNGEDADKLLEKRSDDTFLRKAIVESNSTTKTNIYYELPERTNLIVDSESQRQLKPTEGPSSQFFFGNQNRCAFNLNDFFRLTLESLWISKPICIPIRSSY